MRKKLKCRRCGTTEFRRRMDELVEVFVDEDGYVDELRDGLDSWFWCSCGNGSGEDGQLVFEKDCVVEEVDD